jgi:hypothetical protein
VRLSPLGTAATNWPIVPAPDDTWWWLWSNWWNEDWQGTPKYAEKTCPSATLSTINSTWPDLGSNPGHHSGKPATNRLSYSTATIIVLTSFTISLLHVVQTGSGAHPASYPMGTGGKADHSPQLLPRSIHESIYPLPHMSSWHSA